MKLISRIFNPWGSSPAMDPHSKKPMSFSTSPSSFYHDELERALREQAFGVQSYRISTATSRQASASVTTLESQQLTIILNTQGYSLDSKRSGGEPLNSPSRQQVFESIEGLLQSVSPSYSTRRQERLIAALQKLS